MGRTTNANNIQRSTNSNSKKGGERIGTKTDIILITITTIIIVEIGLGLLDIPKTPTCAFEHNAIYDYKLTPNKTINETTRKGTTYTIKLDKHGYRNEPQTNNNKKEYALVVGDSFIYGLELATKQLATTKLNKMNNKYHYINLGIPANSTIHQEHIIKQANYKYNVKQIHLFFYMNDFRGNLNGLDYYNVVDGCLIPKTIEVTNLRQIKDTIDRYSRIYRVARIIVNNTQILRKTGETIGILEKTKHNDDLQYMQIASDKELTRAWIKTGKTFRSIKDYAKQNNIELYTYYIPYKYQFEKWREKDNIQTDINLDIPEWMFMSINKDLEINATDLYYIMEKEPIQYYLPIDNHLSEKGQELLAQEILKNGGT